jgi:hypothetical protein
MDAELPVPDKLRVNADLVVRTMRDNVASAATPAVKA